jgi:hypothetical protein
MEVNTKIEDEEKPKADPKEDTRAGDKPETAPLIEQANLAAQRLEEATAKQSEILNKQQELYARQRLGGFTEGGQAREEPKKLTDEEYSKKVLSGEANPLKDDGFI